MIDTFTPTAPLQTAVLLLLFNRPETTAQVFEAIRKAKPPRLYVAADGPRADRQGEAEKVVEVREIATAVDWPCEVKILFRDENLGCKQAVSGGITWFFRHEERGIILEDDCLPHPDFFGFCDTLLDRYADDERVSVITGNNFQSGLQRGEASYYFSKYNHCWGWASWRRAWVHYQGDLEFWPEWSKSSAWLEKMQDLIERRDWSKIFNSVYRGEINSWAYPWMASVWYKGGLTATPNVNLVSNIGFGSNATHTNDSDNYLADMATGKIGELRHPTLIRQNIIADRYVFDYVYGGRNRRFPYLLVYIPRRLVGRASRIFRRFFS